MPAGAGPRTLKRMRRWLSHTDVSSSIKERIKRRRLNKRKIKQKQPVNVFGMKEGNVFSYGYDVDGTPLDYSYAVVVKNAAIDEYGQVEVFSLKYSLPVDLQVQDDFKLMVGDRVSMPHSHSQFVGQIVKKQKGNRWKVAYKLHGNLRSRGHTQHAVFDADDLQVMDNMLNAKVYYIIIYEEGYSYEQNPFKVVGPLRDIRIANRIFSTQCKSRMSKRKQGRSSAAILMNDVGKTVDFCGDKGRMSNVRKYGLRIFSRDYKQTRKTNLSFWVNACLLNTQTKKKPFTSTNYNLQHYDFPQANWLRQKELLDSRSPHQPILFEVFCGPNKSCSTVAKKLGWLVVTLDFEQDFNPTIVANVDTWSTDETKMTHCDLLWMSPECKEFSIMRAAKRDFHSACKTMEKALRIKDYFLKKNPNMKWVLENPYNTYRLLQKEDFKSLPIVDVPCADVNYCRFGARIQKHTMLWNNLGMEQRRCRGPGRCRMIIKGGQHAGRHKGFDKFLAGGFAERCKIPERLIKEVIGRTLQIGRTEQYSQTIGIGYDEHYYR